MTIHRRNHLKLQRLLPELARLQTGDVHRLGSEGRKPLSVTVQLRDNQRLLLKLAHFLEYDGEVLPDLHMALLVDLAAGTVEAVSYQNPVGCIDRSKRIGAGLDDFLSLWLSNLQDQRYSAAPSRDVPPPEK